MKENSSSWQQFHDQEAPDYDQLCFTQNTVNEVGFLIDALNFSPGTSIYHALALWEGRRPHRDLPNAFSRPLQRGGCPNAQ